MNKSEIITREDVLNHLKRFFPLAFLPSKLEVVRDFELPADAVVLGNDFEFRSSLLLFTSEDLIAILPQMLADLLTTEDRAGVEAVVSTLNISLESYEQLQQIKTFFGSEIAEKSYEDDKELYLNKLEAFELLDQGQALAVYSWLQLASEWPELHDNIEAVKSALEYWRNRSAS